MSRKLKPLIRRGRGNRRSARVAFPLFVEVLLMCSFVPESLIHLASFVPPSSFLVVLRSPFAFPSLLFLRYFFTPSSLLFLRLLLSTSFATVPSFLLLCSFSFLLRSFTPSSFNLPYSNIDNDSNNNNRKLLNNAIL